jgi:hypothetical protein
MASLRNGNAGEREGSRGEIVLRPSEFVARGSF